MLPEFSFLGEHFYTYPFMIGIAWALAYMLTKPLLIFSSDNQFRIFFLGLFISAWLGGKLLFLLTVDSRFYEQLSFWSGGGFVFYGGLSFGSIFILSFFYLKNIPFKSIHKLMPILAISHAVGRLGCFLTGCCYGEFMTHNLRHPTQLYESLFLVCLAIWLKIRAGRGGETIIPYFMTYASFRFLIEFLRGDDYRGIYFNSLSASQLISIMIIVLTICFAKSRPCKNDSNT